MTTGASSADGAPREPGSTTDDAPAPTADGAPGEPGSMTDDAPRDPGLQPERTRLAWRRTTLACTIVAILAIKTALHDGAPVAGMVGCGVCCALWLGFLGVAQRRMRGLGAARPPVLDPSAAVGAVLLVVALAVCAAVLVAV